MPLFHAACGRELGGRREGREEDGGRPKEHAFNNNKKSIQYIFGPFFPFCFFLVVILPPPPYKISLSIFFCGALSFLLHGKDRGRERERESARERKQKAAKSRQSETRKLEQLGKRRSQPSSPIVRERDSLSLSNNNDNHDDAPSSSLIPHSPGSSLAPSALAAALIAASPRLLASIKSA